MKNGILEVGDVIKADDTWEVVNIHAGKIMLRANFNLRAENKIALTDVCYAADEFVVTRRDEHYSPGDKGEPEGTYYDIYIRQLGGLASRQSDAQVCVFSQESPDNHFRHPNMYPDMSHVTPVRRITGYFEPLRPLLQKGDVVRADESWRISLRQPWRGEYTALSPAFHAAAGTPLLEKMRGNPEMVVVDTFSLLGGDCPKENERHEVFLRHMREDGVYDAAALCFK